MKLVVADHHHDSDAGVYRLVIGEVVEHQAINADGETETVSEIVPIEDIVFAEDDARWAQLAAADVAAMQREIVSDALAERTTTTQTAASTPTPLPGVGKILAR